MSHEKKAAKFGHGKWGKLYKVLKKAFPKFVDKKSGQLDVQGVADKLGLTLECVYKWLRADALPARQADRIIRSARGKVAQTDFLGLFS